GCGDDRRVVVRADRDQRTVESGRALGEALLPGCHVTPQVNNDSSADPLFDPFGSGSVQLDADRAANEVRQRIDRDVLASHRSAFAELDGILSGGGRPKKAIDDGTTLSVAATSKGVELSGPFGVASTMTENLLLEYTNGFRGRDLG